jgi:hypothetical protein
MVLLDRDILGRLGEKGVLERAGRLTHFQGQRGPSLARSLDS